MKIVLPIHEGKVVLLKDEKGYFRPAMGKADAGSIAEQLFGMHGFTDELGAVQMSGEVIEVHVMHVRQVLPATKKSTSQPVEVPFSELDKALHTKGVVLNIFLNVALRMYSDWSNNA